MRGARCTHLAWARGGHSLACLGIRAASARCPSEPLPPRASRHAPHPPHWRPNVLYHCRSDLRVRRQPARLGAEQSKRAAEPGFPSPRRATLSAHHPGAARRAMPASTPQGQEAQRDRARHGPCSASASLAQHAYRRPAELARVRSTPSRRAPIPRCRVANSIGALWGSAAQLARARLHLANGLQRADGPVRGWHRAAARACLW